MIFNELQQVLINTYSDELDDYGQQRKNLIDQRYSYMYIKIYQQNNTADVRYNEATYIGLTIDPMITDCNTIIFNNEEYQIKSVTPSSRLTQVIMVKI